MPVRVEGSPGAHRGPAACSTSTAPTATRRTGATADTFDPGRFRSEEERRRADFIPQGGGPVDTGHRCPGEGHHAFGARADDAEAGPARLADPPDDQEVSLRRVPARPEGGLRVHDVRRTYQPDPLRPVR